MSETPTTDQVERVRASDVVRGDRVWNPADGGAWLLVDTLSRDAHEVFFRAFRDGREARFAGGDLVLRLVSSSGVVDRNALARIEERNNPGKTGNPAAHISEINSIARTALAASTQPEQSTQPNPERVGVADEREALAKLIVAAKPYIENAAPHEQLFNGQDHRNFHELHDAMQAAEAALAASPVPQPESVCVCGHTAQLYWPAFPPPHNQQEVETP